MDKIIEGDKVTFNSDKIEDFKFDTRSPDPSVQAYQKIILAGVDLVGRVQVQGLDLTEVAYPDGWVVPVPTKYLVKL